MNKADFKVNYNRCIGCGNCVRTCPGGLIYLSENKKAGIVEFEEFGWKGCWKCEHCLAVCPTGAISVFGKNPEDSLQKHSTVETTEVFSSMVANRYSCRRFKNQQVDSAVINEMFDLLANAPNGGNKEQVEFTLIDDRAC